MSDAEQKYVVIAEFKNDGALVYETYLAGANYEAAAARMEILEKDFKVIRVCMARLVFERGHPDILPPKMLEMPF